MIGAWFLSYQIKKRGDQSKDNILLANNFVFKLKNETRFRFPVQLQMRPQCPIMLDLR